MWRFNKMSKRGSLVYHYNESRFCIKCCRMFCEPVYSKSRKLHYWPSLPDQGVKCSNFQVPIDKFNQWCLHHKAQKPIASRCTCIGAIFGGSIRPASSPCVMMIPPTKRVLIAHDVCQTYSLTPFSSVNCISTHFEQLHPHGKDYINILKKI